jgi:putative Mg2+ transporter-C (MgtC) family protein
MLVGEFILEKLSVATIDPTRIAAQVVTGIGFLGAGTIIQSRGTITGLTSAATIWVVAGIGLVIGAGFPLLGFLCAVLTLGTLVLLAKIEPKLLGKCHFVNCQIIFTDDGGQARAELATILAEHDVDMSKTDVEKIDQDRSQLKISFCDKHPSHSRFLAELWHAPGVIEILREK